MVIFEKYRLGYAYRIAYDFCLLWISIFCSETKENTSFHPEDFDKIGNYSELTLSMLRISRCEMGINTGQRHQMLE